MATNGASPGGVVVNYFGGAAVHAFPSDSFDADITPVFDRVKTFETGAVVFHSR